MPKIIVIKHDPLSLCNPRKQTIKQGDETVNPWSNSHLIIKMLAGNSGGAEPAEQLSGWAV